MEDRHYGYFSMLFRHWFICVSLAAFPVEYYKRARKLSMIAGLEVLVALRIFTPYLVGGF